MDEEGIIYDGNMEVCCWQMTPEEEARQVIDALLKAAGWEIRDYKDLNLGAGQGGNFSCPTFSGCYISVMLSNMSTLGLGEANV